MELLLQLSVAGLALGSIYALIALGFVVIYRACRVFNFAHGELLLVGAFLMTTTVAVGLPWFVALAVSMLATGSLAAGVERVILRPVLGRSVFVSIIMTIFVGLILRLGVVLVWGVGDRGMPTPWERTGTTTVVGATVTYNSLATIAAAAGALVLFTYLFRRSRIGLGMRATASDPEAAMGIGIPAGRIISVSWFLAGAMAALAGVFLGMFPRVVSAHIAFLALRAFPAVLLGGIESPIGAVIGGLSLGMIEVLAQGYVTPHLGAIGQNLHTVLAYLVMIAVLVVRPYGLFGQREIERV